MSEYDLRGLNGYQVDNLIENRIPFVLINLEVQLESLYSSVQLIHARNQILLDSQAPERVLTEAEQIVAELRQRNAPKEVPVLVLCQEGKKSRSLCDQLEQLGFQNVFYAQGGVLGLKNSRD